MLEVKSFVSRYARRLFFFAADEARPAGIVRHGRSIVRHVIARKIMLFTPIWMCKFSNYRPC